MAEREDDEARAPAFLAGGAAGPARCSGALADLAVADVVQLLQLIGKSAVMTVTVAHEGARSRLWCAGGSLVDAESGRLRGEAAAYRILSLDEGWLEAELRHEERPRTIQAPTQRLLLEAARRKDETLALKRKLGGARGRHRLVREPEPEQLAAPSAAELRLLELLAAAPSLSELLAESELGDLETLTVLDRWSRAGLLASVGERPEAAAPALNARSLPPPAASAPPSALSASPSAQGRVWLAAAGATLLAGASFAAGYVLRDSTAEPARQAALPSSPARDALGTQRHTRALEPAASTRESTTLTGGAAAQLASPAPAAADPDGPAQRPAPLDERTAEHEAAASPSSSPELPSAHGTAEAGRRGTGSTKTVPRPAPGRGGALSSRTGAAPVLSEPRVRVIGATEPSIRLLD